MYAGVDEMEIRNFTVEQTNSDQSLRELTIKEQSIDTYNQVGT